MNEFLMAIVLGWVTTKEDHPNTNSLHKLRMARYQLKFLLTHLMIIDGWISKVPVQRNVSIEVFRGKFQLQTVRWYDVYISLTSVFNIFKIAKMLWTRSDLVVESSPDGEFRSESLTSENCYGEVASPSSPSAWRVRVAAIYANLIQCPNYGRLIQNNMMNGELIASLPDKVHRFNRLIVTHLLGFSRQSVLSVTVGNFARFTDESRVLQFVSGYFLSVAHVNISFIAIRNISEVTEFRQLCVRRT